MPTVMSNKAIKKGVNWFFKKRQINFVESFPIKLLLLWTKQYKQAKINEFRKKKLDPNF